MSADYFSPNVINGHARIWAIRWMSGWPATKYLVHIYVWGWVSELRAAVVDDFGQLVEVQQ